MFVGKRMTKKVITVSAGDTLKQAGHLLHANRIQHLPVVEGDKLVGIISGADIRNSALIETSVDEKGEMVVKNRTVGEIMVQEVITLSPWDTIEDALLIFHQKRFGALPVVEGKTLVGIITKIDILATFIETLSVKELGVRIEVILEQDIKRFHSLIGRLAELNLDVISIILSPFGDRFVAFVRLSTIDVVTVKKELQDAGFTVLELSDFLD